jgi:hypothetical protein
VALQHHNIFARAKIPDAAAGVQASRASELCCIFLGGMEKKIILFLPGRRAKKVQHGGGAQRRCVH